MKIVIFKKFEVHWYLQLLNFLADVKWTDRDLYYNPLTAAGAHSKVVHIETNLQFV